MRVWIVNYYTSPDCLNPRYLQFAKHFMSKGWAVTTFNANFTGDEKVPLFERKLYGEFDFVHVKAPHYKGNGVKRMWSIFKFAWEIYRHTQDFERPDVILHNVHAPFDYPIVWASKKIGSKYISEVWDLWPDQFVQLGLVSANNPIMSFFYWVEKQIYYHADQLVFTSLGCLNYLKKKEWTLENGGKIDLSCVHYINNGVDLEQFDLDKANYPRQDADLNCKDIYKVVYMGSINYANNVKTLIDAAALLQENEKYQFFIYGYGAQRDYLESYVNEKKIKNVTFKERMIPFREVAWVVSQATVNVMTYEKGFAYMGVSAGKLFQYLAAGKPIICNVTIGFDDVISDNNIGIAHDIDTPEAFAMSIKSIVEQPVNNYQAMCERVRTVAEQFDYKKLASEEIKVIELAMKA